MDERVIVRQNREYQTAFLATDPDGIDPDEFIEVMHIHDMTPYEMLLASVGSCTAIVINSFAERHKIDLEEVELQLEFGRVFKEDCENCEEIEKYEDQIIENIEFKGNLTSQDREKLIRVAHYCPIYRMVKDGIAIQTNFIESSG